MRPEVASTPTLTDARGYNAKTRRPGTLLGVQATGRGGYSPFEKATKPSPVRSANSGQGQPHAVCPRETFRQTRA